MKYMKLIKAIQYTCHMMALLYWLISHNNKRLHLGKKASVHIYIIPHAPIFLNIITPTNFWLIHWCFCASNIVRYLFFFGDPMTWSGGHNQFSNQLVAAPSTGKSLFMMIQTYLTWFNIYPIEDEKYNRHNLPQ